MDGETKLLDNDEHPFHPADPPHGSKNYDIKALEPEQQEALNKIKFNQRQDNEVYLNNHPEIRGLVSLIIRHLLDKEATSSQEVQSLLAAFFDRPRKTIVVELLKYFLEINYHGPIVESMKEEISESDEENDE